MRFAYGTLLAVGLAVSAPLSAAAPPALKVPAEVKAEGEYVVVVPETDAVSVLYVALSGAESFPAAMLKDGKSFVLPVRGLAAGRYKFAAVAAGKTGEQARADFTVIVGTPPTPPPGPTPGPTPPTPPRPDDGATGLRKASRDAAAGTPAAERAKLSAAQRSHASAVAAGAFATPAAILAGWREKNNTAGVTPATWAAWGAAVSAKLSALYAAKKLTTNAQWAAAFEEIADGLDDVR
jgi:hypothetical protein